MKKTILHTGVTVDATMSWVEARCPQLVDWRLLALRWLAQSEKNQREKLTALNYFLEGYLVPLNLPMSPASYLSAGAVWPSFSDHFVQRVVRDRMRITYHDHVSDFLRSVLTTDFSVVDEYSDSDILPGYRNPVRRIQKVADRAIDDIDLRPHNDKKLRWITQLYPDLAAWRRLAVEWMAGQTGTSKPRLLAIQCFVREILIEHRLPTEPRAFFDPSTVVPDFYTQTVERRDVSYAKPWTTHLYDFMDWVLKEKFSEVSPDGKRRIVAGLKNPVVSQTKKSESRSSDKQLKWVTQARPELETWRHYAASWLATEKKGIDTRLKALVAFFDKFLIGQNLPTEPAMLLKRGSLAPDFYGVCYVTGKDGAPAESMRAVNNNNRLNEFLDWVLKMYFSIEDDDGVLMVSPAYRNFIPYRSSTGGWVNRETVHSPLPFAFIEDMRSMLCQGPTFRDWTWAQQALGGEMGLSAAADGSDWYAVNAEDIDERDPDCVWRRRNYEAGHSELQMWSPVRWVGLLVKLQIPLRMLQVRVLDSGEADTWRYSAGEWIENENCIAEGTERQPLAQGVFRRVTHLKDVTTPVILYVNTNKTADQKKSGPAKGYEVPWPCSGPIHQNPFYWLERLRNWQEKYNPLKRRTSWSTLGAHLVGVKSDEQLSTYPDACFLFRLRELPIGERHLPMGMNSMNRPWYALLSSLEARLNATGQTDASGIPYVLVPPPEVSKGTSTTYFPMQSLRVSLITALALDGLVPFPILQKLVGHSRLLMTLYHTKMGPAYMNAQLEAGIARLDAASAGSIKRFAAEASYAELMKKTVYNSSASLMNAIAEDIGARNPAGWMLFNHGMCVVGGNTSEVEENRKIGGCHNGGPNVGTELQPKYAPVPGVTSFEILGSPVRQIPRFSRATIERSPMTAWDWMQKR